MQIVKIIEDHEPCNKCGSNLTTLGNFIYVGNTKDTPRQKDEECQCLNCKTNFILHYDFFDEDGHIVPFYFSGDINNNEYHWQDQLTPDQRKEFGEHLSQCAHCREQLTEEELSDAWLASIIHNLKKV